MERLLTSDEVAEYLRVDVVTIRRLVTRGELFLGRLEMSFSAVRPPFHTCCVRHFEANSLLHQSL